MIVPATPLPHNSCISFNFLVISLIYSDWFFTSVMIIFLCSWISSWLQGPVPQFYWKNVMRLLNQSIAVSKWSLFINLILHHIMAWFDSTKQHEIKLCDLFIILIYLSSTPIRNCLLSFMKVVFAVPSFIPYHYYCPSTIFLIT